MSSAAMHPMLNVAVKAARAAGSIINRASMDLDDLKVGSKGVNDFVTEVDHAAEAAIIKILLDAYPQHAILAEESGKEHGNQRSDYQWIIDPLDGTTNYAHTLPAFAVSIGIEHGGRMVMGMVQDGRVVFGNQADRDRLKKSMQ